MVAVDNGASPSGEGVPVLERGRGADVCHPRPSFLSLLIIRAALAGVTDVVVRYDDPSRALRLLARLGGREEVDRVLSFFLPQGCRAERLRHESLIPEYPEVQSWALEAGTPIAEWVATECVAEPLFRVCASRIGSDGTESFVAKVLTRESVYPELIALGAACYQKRRGRALFYLPPPAWSDGLKERVASEAGVPLLPARGWMVRALASLARYGRQVRAGASGLGTVFSFLARRGITLGSPSEGGRIAVEYVDPRYMGGASHHADGVVDGVHVRGDDVLFFLTHGQLGYLRRWRQTGAREVMDEATRVTADRGYGFVALDRVSYGFRDALDAMRFALGSAWVCLLGGSPLAGAVLPALIRDWLDLLPLFSQHGPRSILYMTFPNGVGSFRSNSGVVTGLARRYGARSTWLQTRSIYLRKFEDCLDCFDHAFLWGPAYPSFLGPAFGRYVKGHSFVGSIQFGPEMAASGGALAATDARPRSVLAFTGESVPRGKEFRHHQTYEYTRRFLALLADFARARPDVLVNVKFKDAVGASCYADDPAVGWLFGDRGVANFQVLAAERDDYRSALSKADVVAAVAFTTPGVDALLLGKPVVYYSLLGEGRSHLSALPGATTNPDDFLARLSESVDDPAKMVDRQRVFMDAIDPYRDGLALRRVAEILGPMGHSG